METLLLFFHSINSFYSWKIYYSVSENIQRVAGFTTVNTFEGAKEIFSMTFFRWMFMDRIGIGMLGVYGSLFMAVGVLGRYKGLLIHSIFVSGLAFMFTFQGGNVQHEYYQTVLFPAIALISGCGVAQILELPSKLFHKWLLYPIVIGVFLLSALLAFYKVKDYNILRTPNSSDFTKQNDLIVTDRSETQHFFIFLIERSASNIQKSP
jgi:hypothetical protein